MQGKILGHLHYISLLNGISYTFNKTYDQINVTWGSSWRHQRSLLGFCLQQRKLYRQKWKVSFLYTDPGMKAHLRKFSATEVE